MRKCWKSAHTIPNKIRYLIRHTYCVLSFDALLGFGFDLKFFVCLLCTLNENDRQWMGMVLGLQWPLERIRIFFFTFVFSLLCWFALDRRMRMTVCYDLLVFHSIWPFFKLNGSGTLLIVYSTKYWYFSSTSLAFFFSHLSLIPFGWTVILLPANTQWTKKQQLTMRSHKLCDFNVRLSNSGNKVE